MLKRLVIEFQALMKVVGFEFLGSQGAEVWSDLSSMT